jgi:hypothetical protein
MAAGSAMRPSVAYAVERSDARSWPDDALEELYDGAFPPFIVADPVAKAFIGRVRALFGAFDVMLVGEAGEPVATGWGVPLAWNGEVADLPSGYTDATRRAVELAERGGDPNTFVICGGIVHPRLGRRGLAAELLTALRDLPAAAGLTRVVAPVRPTLKASYPLTPIETYAAWRRADGLPLDPWLRTHERVGGRQVALAPHSQTMVATVAEWEAWIGLALPSTGQYAIPRGLSPLYVDRECDIGTYTEPNVWLQHR